MSECALPFWLSPEEADDADLHELVSEFELLAFRAFPDRAADFPLRMSYIQLLPTGERYPREWTFRYARLAANDEPVPTLETLNGARRDAYVLHPDDTVEHWQADIGRMDTSGRVVFRRLEYSQDDNTAANEFRSGIGGMMQRMHDPVACQKIFTIPQTRRVAAS